MTAIQTVAGPVDSSALGRTLVHEHIFVLGEEYRQNYQDDWHEDQKVEQAVRDLNELKSLGIDTIDIEEPLTELFIRDLTNGIGDTGVRAATLKCAIDAQGLTPGVERTMRAVARAGAETWAPMRRYFEGART